MRRNTRKTWAAIASVAAVSLLASACSSDSDDPADPAGSGDGSKSLTLTVATFNDFGYTDALLKEYMDANAGIKIVHQQAATAPDARTNLTTRLAAGGEDATWDDYFKAGHEFVENSDSAWFDSANATFQGMIGQIGAAYEDPSTGEPTDLESNTAVKGLYDALLAEAPELSAGMNQWEGDWDSAFQNDGFATMLCPPWMTASIEERAGGVDGWNVADVFPGGGGNWGGSFLTVPATGKNIDEAKKLAEWLTSAETQIKAFDNSGTFPSQIEAQSSELLLDYKNSFFNDAPVGAIFSARAKALDAVPPSFKGPNYFTIHSAVQDAITRVDVDKTHEAEASWQDTLSAFSELGF